MHSRRLSFKWKMQDESRLKDEVAAESNIYKQYEGRNHYQQYSLLRLPCHIIKAPILPENL